MRNAVFASILASTLAVDVPTVRLADGRKLPRICLGTGGDNETYSVTTALEVGYPCVDSALDYGDQAEVAKGLASKPRDSYWLQTKVPGCLAGFTVLPPDCHRGTQSAIRLNLERLNVSYVDLLLIHTPPGLDFLFKSCSVPLNCKMIQAQWRALEEAKAAGQALSIGVSNYCPKCYECLMETAKEKPVVNQLEWHVGMGAELSGFKEYFDNEGVQIQAYSPLGPGAMFGRSGSLATDKDCIAVGAKHNVSGVAAAMKWVEKRAPLVSRSTNRAHLISNLDLFSFDLDAEDMAKLDGRTTPEGTRGGPSLACSYTPQIVV
eukprot:TRINITY_DN70699_c0_g1_i1.p1 TRINITY_DN70699_c0_g1~~TRINITY_DN70699_c0_g1_i1.p1  ORF type:complete len:320 (+),score=55.21 TRINITY_DN70699_c0_g1_i1:55-1014(+)